MDRSEATTLSELQAARVMLLALRVRLDRPEAGAVNGYIVRPDDRLLTEDEAAGVLTRLPKPVACEADTVDGRVAITCRPLEGRELAVHRLLVEQASPMWRPQGFTLGHDAGEPRVLLTGAGESLVLSFSELERWSQDYAIQQLGLTQSVRKAARKERKGGVATVVSISVGARWTYDRDRTSVSAS